MAFCPSCGTERREGDRFCPNCGRAYDALASRQDGASERAEIPRAEPPRFETRPPIVVFPVGSPLEAVVGWLVVGLGIGLVGVGSLAAASASTYLQYQTPASLAPDWRGRIMVAVYGALVDPTFAQRADAMLRLRTLGLAGVAVGVVLVLAGLLAVARSRPGRGRWAGPLVALGCAGLVLLGGTAAGATSVVAVPPTPTAAVPTPRSGASVPVAAAPTPFGAPTPTTPGLVLPLPGNPFAAPASPTPSPTPTPIVLDALVELGARFRGDAVRRTVDVDLQPGSQVSGQAVLTRGQDVDFRVVDPRGAPIVGPGRVGPTWSFTFTASTAGQYRLLFDNSYSTLTTKTVSVRYTISR